MYSLRVLAAQPITHKTPYMLLNKKHLPGESDLREDLDSSSMSLLHLDLDVMKLAVLLEKDTHSTAWDRDQKL